MPSETDFHPLSEYMTSTLQATYEAEFLKKYLETKSRYLSDPLIKDEEMSENVLEAREGFTFGCDPELFVIDDTGKAVPAEGLIPGTKAQPHPVEYGAVQVDGMAAEFNIDPVSTFEDWDRNISVVLKQLTAMLPKGYKLLATPSIIFDKDVFDASSDISKELGCHPDHNAWTGKVNPPPNPSKNPYMRTAAGHIHIGWTSGAEMNDLQHLMNCRDLVKQLDWYLGGWSLKKDADTIRRSLYGKAGACRFKDYGVEYRVLSNFWVESKPDRRAVWNRLQKAIQDMTGRFMPDKASSWNDALVHGINEGKLDPYLIQQYKTPLVSIRAV